MSAPPDDGGFRGAADRPGVALVPARTPWARPGPTSSADLAAAPSRSASRRSSSTSPAGCTTGPASRQDHAGRWGGPDSGQRPTRAEGPLRARVGAARRRRRGTAVGVGARPRGRSAASGARRSRLRPSAVGGTTTRNRGDARSAAEQPNQRPGDLAEEVAGRPRRGGAVVGWFQGRSRTPPRPRPPQPAVRPPAPREPGADERHQGTRGVPPGGADGAGGERAPEIFDGVHPSP